MSAALRESAVTERSGLEWKPLGKVRDAQSACFQAVFGGFSMVLGQKFNIQTPGRCTWMRVPNYDKPEDCKVNVTGPPSSPKQVHICK